MDNKVALAFTLNIAAGLSTCIGGILIFFKRFVYLANPTSLGIALGMSAGVMIFISLVEIFHESITNFEQGISGSEKKDDCKDRCQGHARLFASLCFMAGAVLVYLLDFIVKKISPDAEAEPELVMKELAALQNSSMYRNESQQYNEVNLSQTANQEEEGNRSTQPNNMHKLNDHVKQQLNRTGILTAIAIAIHNFPEGMATFLGTMRDTRLGFALAIGIALHNIPEGVAVATPVYFATGNRMKAFLWTCVSALAEPLGGIICWLLLKNGLNRHMEGVIFGLIAGVMVTISFKELLPTAHRYCSHANRVTFAVLGGIAIMSISLILFAYAGV